MLSHNEKAAIIQSIESEHELRVEFIVPLLREMNQYIEVHDVHGTGELGKDVVLVESDKWGDLSYTAVILKRGDITAAVVGEKQRVKVVDVVNQIIATLNSGFSCLRQKRLVGFGKIMVVTNGSITQSAATELTKTASNLGFSNISFKKNSDLVRLVDQYLPEFYTFRRGAVSRYMQVLRDRCARLDELKRITIYSGDAKRILDVFVTPILRRIQKEVRGGEIRSVPVYEKLSKMVFQQHNILIVGGPGSGKSTLVRAQVGALIDSNVRGRTIKLPILVKAERLARLEGTLQSRLQVHIKEDFGLDNFDLLDHIEDPGVEVFVFIDALDEIASNDHRQTLCHLIEEFVQAYPRHRIVLTARESVGFDHLSLGSFRKWELLSFNQRQVRVFVEKWFQSREGQDKRLLTALHDHELLNKLPNTPLVLTLLAILFESDSYAELPANLAELYQMFVDLLLGKWNLDRQVETFFKANHKEYVLSEFAERLHESRSLSLPVSSFEQLIRDVLERLGLTPEVELLKQELLEQTGLVIKNEDNEVEFRHLSFQEYLLAVRLTRRSSESVEQQFVDRVGDDWWLPVLYFYMGLRRGEAVSLLETTSRKISSLQPLQSLRAACVFGYLLQSSYLAPLETRKACIKSQAKTFARQILRLLELVDQGEVRTEIPPVLILLGFIESFKLHYESNLLANVYRNAAQELGQEVDNTMEEVLALLILAALTAELHVDVLDPVLDLAKPFPLLQLALDYQLWVLLEKDQPMRKYLKKLSRELQSRIRRARDAHEVFFRKPRGKLPQVAATTEQDMPG